MTINEYREHAIKLRVAINELCHKVGKTCYTSPKLLEKVLNDIMNGDFTTDGQITTSKIIYVDEYSKQQKPVTRSHV